jgi:hypothetical protein
MRELTGFKPQVCGLGKVGIGSCREYAQVLITFGSAVCVCCLDVN